jgi:hypothetical protein
LIAIWLVPESPRFLIAKGKNEQALQILGKCHARGDINDELVKSSTAKSAKLSPWKKNLKATAGSSSFKLKATTITWCDTVACRAICGHFRSNCIV